MATPTWSPAVAGGQAKADQLNQFLGTHPTAMSYEGVAAAIGNVVAEASTFASNGAWVAQPFALIGTEVRRVRLRLRITAAGAAVTVTLRPDNAGSPSTTVLATIVVPPEFLTTTGRWIDLPLVATGLTAAATYWIVVSSGGDGTNRVLISASGNVSPLVKTSTNGTVWSAGTTQLLFGVAAGTTGQLTGAAEDGGARWVEMTYDAAGNLTAVYEYTGTFRNVRTLSYDAAGNLTGVA